MKNTENADAEMDGHGHTTITTTTTPSSVSELTPKISRRRRVQFSCTECRQRKQSCDRSQPCQRCVRCRRAHLCRYDVAPTSRHKDRHDDVVHDLRAKIARLEDSLAQYTTHSPSGSGESSKGATDDGLSPPSGHAPAVVHPRDRTPAGYYTQNSLFRFFTEIPQLFPFIVEVADQYLRPAGLALKKTKDAQTLEAVPRALSGGEPTVSSIATLLPLKEDTDILVDAFVARFEHVHYMIHLPSFWRDYHDFWAAGQPKDSSIGVLILAVLAITICGPIDAGHPLAVVVAKYRDRLAAWIAACDQWMAEVSFKRRPLVYYQVACLIYLTRRMKNLRREQFWTTTGSLVQSAILDGLHRVAADGTTDLILAEKKHRIWLTVRELELQNSYESGLPSLLHTIESDTVLHPALPDDDVTLDYPSTGSSHQSDPPYHYTQSSHQDLSARSWKLRLEVSRRLFTSTSKPLDYDEVLRYTHQLNNAIDDIPDWNTEAGAETSILVFAILNFQLKECILALHRPYLHKVGSKYPLSSTIIYSAARDVLALYSDLVRLGIYGPAMLREDLLAASLHLTRVAMLQQSLQSSSLISSSFDTTIKLVEQCMPAAEQRFIQSCNTEPWCVLSMLTSLAMVKVQAGAETWQSAKYWVGNRFIALHAERSKGRPQLLLSSEQQERSTDSPKLLDATLPASEWLEGGWANIGAGELDTFDFDFDGLLESWS